MPKKSKPTKEQRRQARLQKGKQWLNTYNGSPKHMNKHYREKFHVDAITAAKDLQALGINYTQEQLDQIKRSEEQRIEQRRREKEKKEQKRFAELYDDCDDRFAFIVGHTSGGAAYGLQWEDVGIDSELPFEEKVRLYTSGEYEIPDYDDVIEKDEPLQLEVLPYDFTVCKVADYSRVNLEDDFCFTGKTDVEKSLVCRTGNVPDNTTEREDGWRAFRVVGSMDFSLVGILADISGVLASRNISIFAISIFDTDYVWVKAKNLQAAVNALIHEGYDVLESE